MGFDVVESVCSIALPSRVVYSVTRRGHFPTRIATRGGQRDRDTGTALHLTEMLALRELQPCTLSLLGPTKMNGKLHHKFPTSGKFERWPLGPEHAGIETELARTAVASTLEPLIFMAEQGMGIAYLPDFAIGRQLREGILVTVLDDYTDRSGPLRVLWPSSRHLSPKLRVFVDFLAANLVPAVEGESDIAGHRRISS